MFGISFTLIPLNQAGALVHVYSDGSIHLNHGGTEMGQGLFTKVAQIVAEEFGVPLHFVRITATNTAKVPNASPTAASSGTDLNGMAAKIAAGEIRGRMAAFVAGHWGVPVETVEFRDGHAVSPATTRWSFGPLAKACRLARVQLSARRPLQDARRSTGTAPRRAAGRSIISPMARPAAEVAIDTLTGEMRVLRADLLHDVGASINPALDIGQVEGGFIQGMGWLTTEELVYDAKGRLTTHAPATYKIPVASDTPPIFNTRLHTRPNPTPSIYRSKAVGEPPLMLAISVYSAILDAVHATSPKRASRGSKRPARRSRSCARSPRLTGAGEGARRSPLAATPLNAADARLPPPHRGDRSRRRGGAGDAGARPGLEPAGSGRAHGGAAVGRLPRHDRRRARSNGWRSRRRSRALKSGRGPALRRSLALGPELAQCCGGRVDWRIETFDARDLEDLGALAVAEAEGAGVARPRASAPTAGSSAGSTAPARATT